MVESWGERLECYLFAAKLMEKGFLKRKRYLAQAKKKEVLKFDDSRAVKQKIYKK
jgi:hypothetical protein